MDPTDTIAASIAHEVRQSHPPHRCPALRDAHPKHHGCVKATFVVEPDSPDLAPFRHGIFARPGQSYPCWVRFSNALKERHDLAADARGMAVKLMGVEASMSGTQDFLMVSHRSFFARDAEDFVDFPATVSGTSFGLGTAARILGYFVDLKRRRVRLRGLIALLFSAKLAWSPLVVTYYSQTPYKLGPDKLMKYRVLPREPRPLWRLLAIRLEMAAFVLSLPFGGMKHSFNMLHDALVRRLRDGGASFDFQVQTRDVPADPADRKKVEDDALAVWSERDFPFRTLAEIRIARLEPDFDNATMMDLGQHLSFTPWHAVRPDHEPIGSINEARRVVYERISSLRHELNGKQRREPRADEPAKEYLASL